MTNVYIIFYTSMVIITLIYTLRKELKYDKQRIWLYKIGLIETFNYIKRY